MDRDYNLELHTMFKEKCEGAKSDTDSYVDLIEFYSWFGLCFKNRKDAENKNFDLLLCWTYVSSLYDYLDE